MSQAGIINISNGDLPPDVPLIFEGNSGSGSAIAHIFEIVGSGGVSTDVVGNVLTITVMSTGFTWNSVTSLVPTNPIQIVAENGYICNGSSQVTFLLPLAPNIGDSFIIISNSATFTITENGSQAMRVGAILSTAGSGTVTSNTVGDQIQFTYVGGNLFISNPPQGTFTIL
jgi:hypothetical protein